MGKPKTPRAPARKLISVTYAFSQNQLVTFRPEGNRWVPTIVVAGFNHDAPSGHWPPNMVNAKHLLKLAMRSASEPK